MTVWGVARSANLEPYTSTCFNEQSSNERCFHIVPYLLVEGQSLATEVLEIIPRIEEQSSLEY